MGSDLGRSDASVAGCRGPEPAALRLTINLLVPG